jgi:hypothetical protein
MLEATSIGMNVRISPPEHVPRYTFKSFRRDIADGILNIHFWLYASWIALVQVLFKIRIKSHKMLDL